MNYAVWNAKWNEQSFPPIFAGRQQLFNPRPFDLALVEFFASSRGGSSVLRSQEFAVTTTMCGRSLKKSTHCASINPQNQ